MSSIYFIQAALLMADRAVVKISSTVEPVAVRTVLIFHEFVCEFVPLDLICSL